MSEMQRYKLLPKTQVLLQPLLARRIALTGHVFSIPPTTQASSPLLCLPDEIIDTILKCLLRMTSGEEDQRQGEGSPDGFQLSSQLLRCCQKLYGLGEHILYGDNVLHVNLDTPNIEIGGLCLPIVTRSGEGWPRPLNMYTLQKPHKTITDLAASLLEDYYGGTNHAIRSLYRNFFSGSLPGLLRLRLIDLDMNLSSRQQTWDCVRLLRDVVQDKRVTVRWGPQDMTEYRAADLVRCFYLWRCRSLKFEGLPTAVTDLAKDMVELVTSRSPVDDIFYKAHCIYTTAASHPDLTAILYELDHVHNESSEDEDNPSKSWPFDGSNDSTRERKSGRRKKAIERHRSARHSASGLSGGCDPYEVWSIIRRGDSSKFSHWQRRHLTVQNTRLVARGREVSPT